MELGIISDEEEEMKRKKRDFKGVLYNRDKLVKMDDGRWCYIDEVININEKLFHKNDKNVLIDILTGEHIEKQHALEVVSSISKVEKGILNFTYGHTHIKNNNQLIPLSYKGGNYQITQKAVDDCKGLIVEDCKRGIFVEISELKKSGDCAPYQEFNNIQKRTNDPKSNMRYGIDSPTYLISEGHKYTFGIEIETSSGILPKYIRNRFNVKCVYDGSLRDSAGNVLGGEYVSGVLKGDKGFEHIQDLFSELSKRCTINNLCSLHLHIGVTPSQEFIVFLYKLSQMIENDLYDMLPNSRIKSPHCRPLKRFEFNFKDIVGKDDYKRRIDEYYDMIYRHYATKDIKPGESYNKLKPHPLGNNGKCGFNHNTPRYCWLNLIPAMFLRTNIDDTRRSDRLRTPSEIIEQYGTAGNTRMFLYDRPVSLPSEEPEVPTVKDSYNAWTIELRQHSPTLNFHKAKNWIKIGMALVYYAENFQSDILDRNNIRLSEVIKKSYPKRGHKLLDYIESRVIWFTEGGDSAEKQEYKDKNVDKQRIIDIINS